MSDRRTRLQQAVLYLVCDIRDDAFVAAALAGGVDIVQLRAKTQTDEQVVTAAQRYRRLCTEAGALLIVNDRPDLAAAVDADGVHVGQDDTPAAGARAVVGPERLVGLSTHSPRQIDAAAGADVDYIGVGPIHATPTKPGRPPVGLELVRYAAAHAALPFFAIGGVAPDTIAEVASAGARRAAVVRALTDAEDPTRVARALRAQLTSGRSVGVGAA